MRVNYYTYFAPDVTVHSVTDDFGNELSDVCLKGRATFNAAKRFVTGMTFEEAGMLTIVPSVMEH